MSQKHTSPWLASWLKSIVTDLAPLWIFITFSACVGFAANQFRDQPLPLVYSSKAERLQHEVDGILNRENTPSAQGQAQNQNAQPAPAQSRNTQVEILAETSPAEQQAEPSTPQNASQKNTAENNAPVGSGVSEASANITLPGEASSAAQEPQFTDLQAVHDIVEGKKPGLILDARAEIFHRFGHIPKALSLPREDFEAAWQQHRERIEKNKPHPLVVYCSAASCEESMMVAAALQKLGLPNVHVFKGGWSDWTAANLSEETTP